jgi:SAM-dependent methyltransferase
MLNDRWRNEFFYEAIHQNVKDKVVLDMGTGSGIFAHYALEAGAKFVYAVECEPSRAHFAEKVLSKNFSKDRFKIIQHDFWIVDLENHISHEIDVFISCNIGPGLFDQGMIKSWRKIKPYLSKNAISIPDKLHLDVCIWDHDITIPFENQPHVITGELLPNLFKIYPYGMVDMKFAQALIEVSNEFRETHFHAFKEKMKWVEINKVHKLPTQRHFDVISLSMDQIDDVDPDISFNLELEENCSIGILNKLSFDSNTLYLKDGINLPWKYNPVFYIKHSDHYNFRWSNFEFEICFNGEWVKSKI